MAGAESLRLFIGLWPDADTRAAIEAQAQAWSWPASTRRTRVEQLHVTVHFLGNVPAARLAALAEGLRVTWSGCELLLDRATVWPGGIAVLEATQVPPSLAALHAELQARLQQLQVPVEERRYRPHVTLARKASGARPPVKGEPLRWRAGPQVLLVQSLPGGRGYEPAASLA